jgi:hypothetical protein
MGRPFLIVAARTANPRHDPGTDIKRLINDIIGIKLPNPML